MKKSILFFAIIGMIIACETKEDIHVEEISKEYLDNLAEQVKNGKTAFENKAINCYWSFIDDEGIHVDVVIYWCGPCGGYKKALQWNGTGYMHSSIDLESAQSLCNAFGMEYPQGPE